MQEFTGLQYVKIDIANQFGLDKELWDDRIAWVDDNEAKLEEYATKADNEILYRKAVYALRDAQAGKPSGFIMGLDATASGPQMLAVLTGCLKTAARVNLINTGKREDLYLSMAICMGLGITRDIIKNPLMVTFYNSKAEPKKVFGDDTPEYIQFMETLTEELPGAMLGMQTINNFWNPEVPAQVWVQLDGMVCHVNVKTQCKTVVEVEEIGSSFTYIWEELGASSYGISIPANLIQSFDALVVREMKRRCNYNPELANMYLNAINYELGSRANLLVNVPLEPEMICMNQLEELPLRDISGLTTFDLNRMGARLSKMLSRPPFPLITVHDEFKAHPNNMNLVRYHYKEIMAEIAESPAFTRVLGSMQECGSFEKLSYDLPALIRESEYALS